jgi:hypothetical protein
MCIHSESSARQWNNEYLGKERAVVVLKRASGEFSEAWVTDVRTPQKVANTIRDVLKWHPGEGKWADLSMVNAKRLALGLEALDRNGLPFPIGEAHPGFDKARAEKKLDDELARTKAEVEAYLKAQRLQEQRQARIAKVAEREKELLLQRA